MQGKAHKTISWLITPVLFAQSNPLTPNQSNPDELANGVRLHQGLDLPVGQLILRVGVMDRANGYTGVTEFPFSVPPAPPRAAQPQ